MNVPACPMSLTPPRPALPRSAGYDAPVQGTGNLYLGGGLSVGVGLAGKAEVNLNGQGWVMGRYSQPSEQVVVRLQAAPSVKIWKLPAINLGQMETVFQYRDSQVWLSLQRRASLSNLMKDVPVIGEALSKVLQDGADAGGYAEMDIYSSWNGSAAAPNGGAVRLRFGVGFRIAGPVAEILGLGKGGVTLNANFALILMVSSWLPSPSLFLAARSCCPSECVADNARLLRRPPLRMPLPVAPLHRQLPASQHSSAACLPMPHLPQPAPTPPHPFAVPPTPSRPAPRPMQAGPQDTRFRLIFDFNGKLFAIPFW